MKKKIADIISEIDNATTHCDFKEKFGRTFSNFGYNKFAYASSDVDSVDNIDLPNTFAKMVSVTNIDPLWEKRYVDKDYASADPIIRDSYASRLPIRWTESYHLATRSPQEHTMMSDDWENGIQRGLTVPLHGAGSEFGVLSLYSDLTDHAFLKSSDTNQHEIHIIAHYFHDAAQRKLRSKPNAPNHVGLTNRELEVLKWTADGKTAPEISSILNVSNSTVNFHIQNIIKKLGAQNKANATAIAVGRGLINL